MKVGPLSRLIDGHSPAGPAEDDDPVEAIDAALLTLDRGEGSFAIFLADRQRNLFAQVAPGTGSPVALHGEIVGNMYLAAADRLPPEVLEQLGILGWNAPAMAGEFMTRDWQNWRGVHRRLVAEDLWAALTAAFHLGRGSQIEIDVNL